MRVTVNGDSRSVREGTTLRDLLAELSLEDKPVAVERNLAVVPKAKYGETRLAEGDKIEIVQFVGGG